MLKVVFDTVVFVRALIKPQNYAGRVVFDRAHDCELYLSRPVVEEMLEVLRRPELTRLFTTLVGMDLRAVLDLIGQAQVVEIEPISEGSRDPTDNIFLATARAARADYLVSEDKDLLDMGKFEQTEIISAAAFLRILDQESR